MEFIAGFVFAFILMTVFIYKIIMFNARVIIELKKEIDNTEWRNKILIQYFEKTENEKLNELENQKLLNHVKTIVKQGV